MKSKVIYEDKSIIVIHKPAGVATQTAKVGQIDVVSEVKNYLAGEQEPYVALINRLDQPVEGIVLIAKDDFAAKELSAQLQKNQMQKKYYALVLGQPKKKEAMLKDYLVKDSRTNASRIACNEKEKGAKCAELSYHILRSMYKSYETEGERVQVSTSLADITLKTGRHHQIRVQMAHAGLPILGDSKYGSAESIELSQRIGMKNVALCAYSLTFIHPKTKKEMHMQVESETFANL